MHFGCKKYKKESNEATLTESLVIHVPKKSIQKELIYSVITAYDPLTFPHNQILVKIIPSLQLQLFITNFPPWDEMDHSQLAPQCRVKNNQAL